jgi:NitT/TauT family transport system ATP-binding protein
VSELILIRQLTKVYTSLDGAKVQALRDVTFDIGEGEFISLVGPSGCGKSTLLKILAGILPKSQGVATFKGKPIDGPRDDIGVVFQSPVLLPWRTVLENALLPIEILRLDKNKYRDRALSLLDLVGLSGFENRYPYELSGGMQQRNAIVRALIHDPAILLMDEPFGALDAMTREQMNLELLRIWQEAQKTVLLITHSITEAVFLASKVLVMSARPGYIMEVIDVDLSYPRQLDVMSSEKFGRYTQHIRQMLY